MTLRQRNRILIAALVIGSAAATLLPMIASSGSDDIREIRLVVRDMTYYLDGQAEPNPTLTVTAGEQVRLVLKNDDPGMRHDFVVTAWQVGTRMLEDGGEHDTVTFRVPAEPGDQSYHCTPHAKKMRGTIRVE